MGADIIKRALCYPIKLIAQNAGVNGSVVMNEVMKNLDRPVSLEPGWKLGVLGCIGNCKPHPLEKHGFISHVVASGHCRPCMRGGRHSLPTASEVSGTTAGIRVTSFARLSLCPALPVAAAINQWLGAYAIPSATPNRSINFTLINACSTTVTTPPRTALRTSWRQASSTPPRWSGEWPERLARHATRSGKFGADGSTNHTVHLGALHVLPVPGPGRTGIPTVPGHARTPPPPHIVTTTTTTPPPSSPPAFAAAPWRTPCRWPRPSCWRTWWSPS